LRLRHVRCGVAEPASFCKVFPWLNTYRQKRAKGNTTCVCGRVGGIRSAASRKLGLERVHARRGATFAASSKSLAAALRSGPCPSPSAACALAEPSANLHGPAGLQIGSQFAAAPGLRDHIEVVVLFIVTVCEK